MELEAKYVSSFVYVLQIYCVNKSEYINNLCSCVEPETQNKPKTLTCATPLNTHGRKGNDSCL